MVDIGVSYSISDYQHLTKLGNVSLFQVAFIIIFVLFTFTILCVTIQCV